jgi:hypothetical protein
VTFEPGVPHPYGGDERIFRINKPTLGGLKEAYDFDEDWDSEDQLSMLVAEYNKLNDPQRSFGSSSYGFSRGGAPAYFDVEDSKQSPELIKAYIERLARKLRLRDLTFNAGKSSTYWSSREKQHQVWTFSLVQPSLGGLKEGRLERRQLFAAANNIIKQYNEIFGLCSNSTARPDFLCVAGRGIGKAGVKFELDRLAKAEGAYGVVYSGEDHAHASDPSWKTYCFTLRLEPTLGGLKEARHLSSPQGQAVAALLA